MDDPILAAVPALLALPGLLLQPWSVLFLIIPGGLLFAPLLTTVVTVLLFLLWVLLDHQGKLDRARRILARLRRPRAILVMGLVVVCALAVGLARLVYFPPLRRGIPPHTFQHVVKDMQFDPDTARYYCLCLVRFGDSQWLLQVRLSEQDLEVLANKSRMHPIPADRIGKIYLDMRPYWWRPVISDRVRSLATTDFSMDDRGPDGLHLLATWNPPCTLR